MPNDHLAIVQILADYCIQTGRFSVCPTQRDIVRRLQQQYQTKITTRTLQAWLKHLEGKGLITRAKQNSRGVGGNTILPITHYRLTQKAIRLIADQGQLAKSFLSMLVRPKETRK